MNYVVIFQILEKKKLVGKSTSKECFQGNRKLFRKNTMEVIIELNL